MRWLKQLLFDRVKGDMALIDAVANHVTKWVGEPSPILHERISISIHVDFYVVPATEERPFHTVVTSGMAQKSMLPPAGAEDKTQAELVMFLPASWPIDEIASSQQAYWPIRILRLIAGYPHEHKTWVWLGHTIVVGEGDPIDSGFSAVLFLHPLLLAPEGGVLTLEDGRKIAFLGVVMLRPEEHEFDMAEGDEALLDLAEAQDRFDELEIFTPGRKSFIK